jgi:lipid II:glycine glycyltransferase (peptidoglycan interpeptide bridge formation enzyme)
MRPATREEIARWDELVERNPDGGQILQTRAWGEFKRQHGWLPLYWRMDGNGSDLSMLVLQRSFAGLGNLWYVPKGPGVAEAVQLGEVVTSLRRDARPFAVKLEPELVDTLETQTCLRELGLIKTRHDVQISRATVLVDLRPDEESLLASFKPKTRYNIRLAGRHGVEVFPVALNDGNVDTMFALMAATQSRAGFTLRSKPYFAGYWRLHEAAGQGQLFFATWQGEVLAGVFATFLGRKGWYKDGGSVKEHAEVMAPHLLQWEVMRWLRSRGVESYDLVAVPPAALLAPEHPLYGLYRFKSGFSDAITEFVGTWDLPIHRTRYQLWDRILERAAHQWSYRVRHDLFY